MWPDINSSTNPATFRYHPEALRRARLRNRYGMSDALTRAIAGHAYGEPEDAWHWVHLANVEDAAAAADRGGCRHVG